MSRSNPHALEIDVRADADASYGIIQKHNGSIEVESEPGNGTTFRITLPIRQGGPHTNKDNET